MDIPTKLLNQKNLTDDEFLSLLNNDEFDQALYSYADKTRREIYDDSVFVRGLIEFTNYCKNNCYYCGIRCENKSIQRYRLTKDEISSCCEKGYNSGYRTFVLQGGEDMFFTDKILCDIVYSIKNKYPDCAVTLSVGEKEKSSYISYFNAGADRYLLRHETADNLHYAKLHPQNLSLENRKKCLYNLKEIGYQVGAGFMVGSPYQTKESIIADLRFLQELQPDMIGIGPFIHHKDTPFKNFENGSASLTLKLISILRMMLPYVLLPATTALGTINDNGYQLGLKAGANVIMPNITPPNVKELYTLYDNKISISKEQSQIDKILKKQVESVGYKIVVDKGDVRK